MVHWYQWYDWYQWKMMPFQWFYWCKTSSLLHQVKARYNSYEYSSFYKPTTQNKFAFTPSKNALIIIINIPRSISQPRKTISPFTPSKNELIIIMDIPRSISQPRKTSSLLHQVKARYNSYEYSSFYKTTTQNK